MEFALVMLPLFFLVFGIIQYGWYFYSMQAGASAVGDATRRISVGDCANTAELKTMLKNRLGSATTASASSLNPSVTYTNADGSSVAKIGGTVTVSLTYPTLNMKFPLIPVPNNGDVVRTVTARVEDTAPSGAGCT